MNLNIKKIIQNFFKKIGYSIFLLLYGRIKEVVKFSDNQDVQFFETDFKDGFSYKLYVLNKCRMYTDTVSDAAFIINNKIIEGPSFQYRNVTNANCKNNVVLEKGTPRIKKNLKGNVFSLLTGGAGNDNYWHWMFDVLPRLGILKRYYNYDNIDFFLLPDVKQKYQKESLDLLQIDFKKRLSSLNYRHISADQIITVDHPYVINNNATEAITKIPKWIITWLKQEFLKNLKEDPNDKLPKKFYIDRKDSTSNRAHLRKIINENEIKEYLKEKKYEPVSLGHFDFIDQIRLFKNAESIIGLHGAGFANVIFCNPKTKILELKPHSSGEVIKNLSSSNELQYFNISIKPESNNNNDQFGHINVPINSLEKVLKNF